MLIIPVQKGNIGRALKSFKIKFKKTGVLKELRERENFVKPSLKRKLIKDKAIRKLKNERKNNNE